MFEITNLNPEKVIFSKSFLQKIKENILGKKYNLSVVFLNNKESIKINKKYRNKNKASNVLSFPLEKNSGEIFLNIDSKKEAPNFDMSAKKFLAYLFIHGCLHLKGYDHGDEMEKQEDLFLKKFYNKK